jgi:hypothetical protein
VGSLKNAVFWVVTPCGHVRTDVSEELWFSQEPHGVTSQKTAFFIVTAVNTSNLTGEEFNSSRQRCMSPLEIFEIGVNRR